MSGGYPPLRFYLEELTGASVSLISTFFYDLPATLSSRNPYIFSKAPSPAHAPSSSTGNLKIFNLGDLEKGIAITRHIFTQSPTGSPGSNVSSFLAHIGSTSGLGELSPDMSNERSTAVFRPGEQPICLNNWLIGPFSPTSEFVSGDFATLGRRIISTVDAPSVLQSYAAFFTSILLSV
ncbi:hypothetical protein BDR05DRAFT_1006166 [Suillus weaverae]|nr:hypothetical protein BDR05DRAFT_1006166 [Suillus weaverae]